VQAIDYNDLARNRDWLVNWQHQQWNRKADGLRLHLGSGHTHMDGYVNVDPYTEESDVKEDMRFLSFKPGSVIEIVCHHALEHIPMRDVYPALQHWYDILAPGGTVEIGMPDIELCAQEFVENPWDSKRWSHDIWYLFGGQTDDPSFSINWGHYPEEKLSFSAGQVHMNGFNLGRMVETLERIGFRMIHARNYDANGCAPSLFVYAEKPANRPLGNILEQDTVMGTFSNKTIYIEDLWASATKYLPETQFITRFTRYGINIGMTQLREDFIKTGKRYWCFLDDDIQFLHKDTMRHALETLVNGKYGAVSVYSSFDPKVLTEPYDPSRYPMVVTRPHKWATGYFILVDSEKVGHILPDLGLPYPNQSVDTSYSVSIRKAGYDIGISGDYVYHVRKNTIYYKNVLDETNDYLMKKWGQFYYDWARYDGNVIEWPIGSVGL
jgi:hypothetical protein